MKATKACLGAVAVVFLAALIAACSGRFFASRCHCGERDRAEEAEEEGGGAPGARAAHHSSLAKLSGMVEDCCCDYATVNALNERVLHPLLQSLVSTPFFRYYKAKLWCDCPFWPDDGMCVLRDCSVCECPEDEFPENFRREISGRELRPLDDLICQEGKPQAAVDRTLDRQAFTWKSRDNPWTADDERDEEDVTYVNLLLNPERYTGYKGPSARRIWDAIYNDNVLVSPRGGDGNGDGDGDGNGHGNGDGDGDGNGHGNGDGDGDGNGHVDGKRHGHGDGDGDGDGGHRSSPPESRVLYKLISGLHSSISVHIAADYLVDEATSRWGKNVSLLRDRVTKHPDRVRNLYFTFLLVLRAVTKASDYLIQAEYDTGNPAEDRETARAVVRLVRNERLQAACPKPFDEAKLWKGSDGSRLLMSLQRQFRNISAIMDCVGCEKCRLWGKLQILGLGTALEILFSEDSPHHDPPVLQRNEVIALVNLLNRLSESLHVLQELAPLAKEPRISLHPVSMDRANTV